MKPEIDALVTGLPSMSLDDQQAVIDAVMAHREKLLQSKLGDLAAKAAGVEVEKRVARFVKLRDARAENTRANDRIDAIYKGALEAIERSLLATANEQGVSGFRTEAGTAYVEERTLASIADDAVFFDFVRQSGDLDFFERRLKVTHVKEYADANHGQFPPGLNIFRENTVKVRRK